jgi:hypothetical protein
VVDGWTLVRELLVRREPSFLTTARRSAGCLLDSEEASTSPHAPADHDRGVSVWITLDGQRVGLPVDSIAFACFGSPRHTHSTAD